MRLGEPNACLDARAEHEAFQEFAASTPHRMAVLSDGRQGSGAVERIDQEQDTYGQFIAPGGR